MDLSDKAIFTDELLKKELVRRDIQAKEASKPKPLKSPNLSLLQEACDYYINSLFNKEYSKDAEYYIYEKALEALYGDNIFDWINDQH